MPPHQIEEHVLVCGAHLVVHLMAAVGYLEAASLEKFFNHRFNFRGLPEVPVCKVPSLVVSEGPRWVLPKRLNGIREEVVDMPLHQLCLGPGVEIVYKPKERGIVGVRHDVDRKCIVFFCLDLQS